MGFLLAVALFATALLLGGMVFFAACVAPLVFAHLPPEQAGGLIRRIFPVYYLYVLGTAAAAGVALLPLRPADAAAMFLVAAVTLWLRQSLMPRINADSDAARAAATTEDVAAARARFARGHRLSVLVNGAQMLAAAVVLARFAV